MSKRLPKATQSTLSDIHRESVGVTIDVIAQRVPNEPTDTILTPTRRPQTNSELRRTQASNIVERYTTYSALGGCIPLIIFDSLSVGLIIFNMVRALTEHYDIPFQQDKIKACIAALVVGVAAPSAGSVATQLLSKIIPGAWIIGTAASSAAAAACTRYAGQAFIEHFESGGTVFDVDIANLQAYFNQHAAA